MNVTELYTIQNLLKRGFVCLTRDGVDKNLFACKVTTIQKSKVACRWVPCKGTTFYDHWTHVPTQLFSFVQWSDDQPMMLQDLFIAATSTQEKWKDPNQHEPLDIVGIKPLTKPEGKIFTIRARYTLGMDPTIQTLIDSFDDDEF